jgi:hypothetical protein
MRSIALPTALAILLIAITITGCDVIRVDAPTDTEKVITELYEATSVSEAESAVRRFLVSAEIGGRWTDSPLKHYELTNKEIRQLAEAQLAFNRGQQDRVTSAENVYQAASRANDIRSEGQRWMRTPLRPIHASSSEISTILRTLTMTDGEGLDAAEHTLLAAIVARDGGLAANKASFSQESQLSPVQQFAYSVWLSHYGPRIVPFESTDEIPAAGKALSSGFYMTGGGACDCFSNPSDGGQLRWMVVQYQGAQAGTVEVRRNNPGTGVFFGPSVVQPDELFVVINSAGVGTGIHNKTIGNNVLFYLNNQLVTGPGSKDGKIHTSCSIYHDSSRRDRGPRLRHPTKQNPSWSSVQGSRRRKPRPDWHHVRYRLSHSRQCAPRGLSRRPGCRRNAMQREL